MCSNQPNWAHIVRYKQKGYILSVKNQVTRRDMFKKLKEYFC
jgi:hypothetical protein